MVLRQLHEEPLAQLKDDADQLKMACLEAARTARFRFDSVEKAYTSYAAELDQEKLQEWLSELLGTFGNDIFRMKGVLSIKGDAKRFVFQGVHMLFDGREDRPWGKEPRTNKLIFIGRNLDRAKLTEGFRSCLWGSAPAQPVGEK